MTVIIMLRVKSGGAWYRKSRSHLLDLDLDLDLERDLERFREI